MTTYVPQGDVAKLPKWAQTALNVLQMHVRELEAQLTVGPEESDTWVDRWRVQPATPLGLSPTVAFRLDRPGVVDTVIDGDVIRARVRDSMLSIETSSNALIVQSQSSNIIRVRTGEWW